MVANVHPYVQAFSRVLDRIDLEPFERPNGIATYIPIYGAQIPGESGGVVCHLIIQTAPPRPLVTIDCEFEFLVPEQNIDSAIQELMALNAESLMGAWGIDFDTSMLSYRMWHYVAAGAVPEWVAETYIDWMMHLEADSALQAAYGMS